MPFISRIPARPLVIAMLALLATSLAPRAAAAQERISICSTQSVPAGWVVVSVSSRPDCGGYYSGPYNSLLIEQPGETVTMCTTFGTPGQGYVMTAQTSTPDCPGYYGSGTNRAQYRRIAVVVPDTAPTPAPAPAPPPSVALQPLDRFVQSVYGKLDWIQEDLRLFVATHAPWHGSARQGQTAAGVLQVEAGRRYTVIAACDDDCTDLDLRVLDGNYVVGQDVEPSEAARLELAPAASATLTVEVVMAACGHEPCAYGVRIYETPPSGAPPVRRRPRNPLLRRP